MQYAVPADSRVVLPHAARVPSTVQELCSVQTERSAPLVDRQPRVQLDYVLQTVRWSVQNDSDNDVLLLCAVFSTVV